MVALASDIDEFSQTLYLDAPVRGLRKGAYISVESEVMEFVTHWSRAQVGPGLLVPDHAKLMVRRGALASARVRHAAGVAVRRSRLLLGEGDAPSGGDSGQQGPPGPKGDMGDSGEPGPQGPAGADGLAGAQGEPGPIGPQGADGAVGPSGAQGPEGPQGEQGPVGEDGAQGPAGPQGIQGDTGLAGSQGPQGDPGVQGGAGAQGPAGPPGITLIRLSVAARTYTNLGAGPTESNAADRAVVDLTGRTDARVIAHVSTQFVTGNVKVQYSTNASSWSDLTTGLVSQTSTGLKASASAAIPAGAKALVILRLVGYGGNGTEDPVVNAAVVEVTG